MDLFNSRCTVGRLAGTLVLDNRLLAQGTTSGVTTCNYDTVDKVENFTYRNGVAHAYSDDPLNRRTQMGSSKNSTAIPN